MLLRAPLVQAKQDGSIRIHYLTKVVMARRCLGLAEERVVPSEAAGNVVYADDRPCAFHRISVVGLTVNGLQTHETILRARSYQSFDHKVLCIYCPWNLVYCHTNKSSKFTRTHLSCRRLRCEAGDPNSRCF